MESNLDKIDAIIAKFKRIADGESARYVLQEPETSEQVRLRARREREIITSMAIRGGKIPKEYLPLNLESEEWLTQ